MADWNNGEITPLNRAPLSELILEKITDFILAGKLRPGDKLPTEQEFAAIFKVGRNSIREAVRMLSSTGIIEIKRGSGTYIRETVSDSMLNPLVLSLIMKQGTSKELIEMRLFIESFAAELAINNATDEDIERLEAANQKLKDAAEKKISDAKVLYELDLNVHFTLFEIGKNMLFIKVAKTLYKLFIASLTKVIEQDLQNSYDNHEKYIKAIRKRDPELARKMVVEGLSYWKEYMDR
jgi:GntR family transcriptional repressor for pyruvate dehydrogenase complex